MEFQSISLALLTVSASLLILPTFSLTPQDVDRLTQQRRAGSQHQLSYSARPTQFMPASQVSQSAHDRGALIMPANSPIQTNSFYSSSQQLKQAHYEPMNSALLTAEFGVTGKTVTSAPRAFNSSQRHETGGGVRGFSASSPLELALRQASTDESVFQTSPIIGPPEPNLEWLSQASLSYHNSQQQQQQTATIGSTTEQNNNIAQNEPAPAPAPKTPPIHYTSLDSQESSLPFSQNERASLSNRASINLTQPSERNNQVVYEGPATAPPAGDYYFSSAEKLPNREKASNFWW